MTDEDPQGDIESYFTDAVEVRERFDEWVRAPTGKKRIFVVHGIGGVGKSSLLSVLRNSSRKLDVVAGIISGQDLTKPDDAVLSWRRELLQDGTPFPVLDDAIKELAETATKVRKRLSEIAPQLAVRTAEGGSESLVGGALGHLIPIPGIGEVLSAGVGAATGLIGDAVVQKLKESFGKAELELLRDPSERLTVALLADLKAEGMKRRLVLMFDAYEKAPGLEEWLVSFARRLPPNVLLVVAGHAPPAWDHLWPDWRLRAIAQELRPLVDADIRTLVLRYCRALGLPEPNAKQVEEIVSTSGGLPLSVTTTLQLVFEYGLESFDAGPGRAVADLVDRVTAGVPSEMRPILEAAAISRWFDQDILAAMIQLSVDSETFRSLTRFPFVRTRADIGASGFATTPVRFRLHDSVRELMEQEIRSHSETRYRGLHRRAASHFEQRLKDARDFERHALMLECIHHTLCAAEPDGLRLFTEYAESLARHQLTPLLESVVAEVSTFQLETPVGTLWTRYYRARCDQLRGRFRDAEAAYRAVAEEAYSEPRLRAYALCDQAELLARYELIAQTGSVEPSVQAAQGGLAAMPTVDAHTVRSHLSLARAARYQADWERDRESLVQASNYFSNRGDGYGSTATCVEMRAQPGRRGLWAEFFRLDALCHERFASMTTKPDILRAHVQGSWIWAAALAGRVTECRRRADEAVKLYRALDEKIGLVRALRDSGWCLGVENKFVEAHARLVESLDVAAELGALKGPEEAYTRGFRAAVLLREGRFDEALVEAAQSHAEKTKLHVNPGILESQLWQGLALEFLGDTESAAYQYGQAIDQWRNLGYVYFESAVLLGLWRTTPGPRGKQALERAHAIALDNEHHDHLAMIHLELGHLAWPESKATDAAAAEEALGHYQRCLVAALRHSPYTLYDLLAGRTRLVPSKTIGEHCSQQASVGLSVLRRLKDWWTVPAETGLGARGPATALSADEARRRRDEQIQETTPDTSRLLESLTARAA